jgi:hypothetical protein
MDNVIGLGEIGCNVADKFLRYSQYKVYKINIDNDLEPPDWSWASYDVDENGGYEKDGVYKIRKQDGPEQYEKNYPNLGHFFRNVKGEVLFIVSGSDSISAAALAILQQIKNCDINVLYIRPELESFSSDKIKNEWVVFNVLQEYARSGVFKRIYLVNNSEIEKHLGEVPVIGYYDRLNEMIASTLHMINVYSHNEAEVSTFSEPDEINRISTIGFVNFEDGEKRLFYPLDEIKELCYYYAINKRKLEEDGDLFKKIKEQVKNDIKTSYEIFATKYAEDYSYIIAYSSQIQRKK